LANHPHGNPFDSSLIISCKKAVLFSHTSISNNDLPLALPEGGGAAMAA
jgi:hypothetical protein